MYVHLHGPFDVYSETDMLRFLPFFDSFMDILPIILMYSGENVADSYHRFLKIVYHTILSVSKRHHFRPS